MALDALELQLVKHTQPSMGGGLQIAMVVEPEQVANAAKAARRAARRVEVWASRLTRFSPASDLSRLNARSDARSVVRPTLGAVLAWAHDAQRRSSGIVDVSMLDQRLAAERGSPTSAAAGARAWRIDASGRSAIVARESAFRFDLDGVAKGWIADRAADLLHGWPGVAVDADGDIALHADPGVEWLVDVTDPRRPGEDDPPLATLRVNGGDGWRRGFGVATSGTSVHRWQLPDGQVTHHLIDRRTGLPADTDVVQATVVAPSAREAEMIAKSAVILGARRAYSFLEHSAALAAILLLECDDIVAMPGSERWLA